MEVFFIRHGQSTNNAEKKVAGTYDCSLTSKGVEPLGLLDYRLGWTYDNGEIKHLRM